MAVWCEALSQFWNATPEYHLEAAFSLKTEPPQLLCIHKLQSCRASRSGITSVSALVQSSRIPSCCRMRTLALALSAPDCIIGANTTFGLNTTIEGGEMDVVLNDEVYHDVTVRPGALVGNDTTVGSASLVSGRIEDGSHIQRG